MAKEETKKCKKCMEEINKKAKRCPKCGANLGIPGFVKVLIVLALKSISDHLRPAISEARSESIPR